VRRLLEYLREHGAEVARELERGPVTLELEGERVELRPGDLKVKKEVSYRGEGVEVLGLPERGILLLLKPS